ncbi:MAG: D-alanine--D-alanine ligase, partial [Synechococcus sp.]
MPSSPITVGLVFGGRSGEHDVSIRSAATVVRGLRSGKNNQRYTVHPIY